MSASAGKGKLFKEVKGTGFSVKGREEVSVLSAKKRAVFSLNEKNLSSKGGEGSDEKKKRSGLYHPGLLMAKRWKKNLFREEKEGARKDSFSP